MIKRFLTFDLETKSNFEGERNVMPSAKMSNIFERAWEEGGNLTDTYVRIDSTTIKDDHAAELANPPHQMPQLFQPSPFDQSAKLRSC